MQITHFSHQKVIIPTLHISLGVFKKVYDLFEEECHMLDVTILKERLEAEDDANCTHFDQMVASEASRLDRLQRDIQVQQSELERLQDELPLNLLNSLTDNHAYSDVANRVDKQKADIATLVSQYYFKT